MNRKIDLHMHTIHSDGTLTCKELIDAVRERNIEIFSVTDHENIDSIKILEELTLNDDKLFYIKGVELAVTYDKMEFHLTVYGFDEKNSNFVELVNKIAQVRINFGIEIIEYLQKTLYNVNIDLNEYSNYSYNPKLGGWKALNFLIEKKIVTDISNYFELLTDCTIEKKFPHPREVISIAKEARGFVFLAHPSSNQFGGLDIKYLDAFRNFGVSGIECYSPYCKSKKETNNYLNYCNNNDLYISGGSDYHGEFVNRELGTPDVTLKDISGDLFLSFITNKGD